MKKCSYYLLICLLYPLSLLPLRVHYFFSDIFYFFIYRIFGYRKSTVYINLARSFPELKYPALQELARRFYRHFADLIAETLWMGSVSGTTLAKKIRIENTGILREHYAQQRSTLLLMGHTGNWEYVLASSDFARREELGYPQEKIAGIYKALENPVMDKLYLAMRKRFGFGAVVESKRIVRFMAQHRRESWIYALIADQSPLPGSRYCVDFLHQPTLMMNGPEQLARSMNHAVVYFKITKERRGHYLIRLIPICDHPSELPEGGITAAYAKCLEENIYEQPEIWLWSHKRWKRDVGREMYRTKTCV